MYKNTRNVRKCPPQPRSGSIVLTHQSGTGEGSIHAGSHSRKMKKTRTYQLICNGKLAYAAKRGILRSNMNELQSERSCALYIFVRIHCSV